ncbi:DUF3048 domain-containing protein [Actinophytocola algeriensis]|uniref:DUF3048 family protein n=1 Tax=Actinophytocola algeriensis TaxID=1768010 RepID=A0A7W7QD09_9PSEU|nr:DUF3048 domain-containing protein [Actinophytocola algeriensis]MBB4911014.1 hypothetical protein [Actinophytocola algeriensis]MBE1474007.1 hypothetical protein [Actinophytocola algeriensis]
MARRVLATTVAAAVVAVVAAVVGACDLRTGGTDEAPDGTPTAPVLAVKIDNVPAARPQTGLGAADVVYVEPVEGGLTRLVAVFSATLPDEVGPVRSARRTDLDLLAQYGKPVLAYSGAAPELLPALRSADLVNASPAEAGSAFHRDRDRRAPHNLYVRPAELPGGATGPAEAPLLFGAAPEGGTPSAGHDVAYSAAHFGFTWSAPDGRWRVAMNGSPMTSTESGPLTAATVVVQRVVVTAGETGEDAAGSASPVAQTVGSGQSEVLRDGRVFAGTWSRPAPDAPTRFRTAAGAELPLAAGPVWVLLVPA